MSPWETYWFQRLCRLDALFMTGSIAMAIVSLFVFIWWCDGVVKSNDRLELKCRRLVMLIVFGLFVLSLLGSILLPSRTELNEIRESVNAVRTGSPREP